MQLTITLTAPEPVELPVLRPSYPGMIIEDGKSALSRYLHDGFQLEKAV